MGILLRRIASQIAAHGSVDEARKLLDKAKAMPEGTMREWQGKKYKKQGGKWVEQGKGRTAAKEEPTEKKGKAAEQPSKLKEKKPSEVKPTKGKEAPPTKGGEGLKKKPAKGKKKDEAPQHIESMGLGKDLKNKFTAEEWKNIGTDVKKQDNLISSLIEDKKSSGAVDKWMKQWEELYDDGEFKESQEDLQALLEGEKNLSVKEKALLESVKDINGKIRSAENASTRARRDRLGVKKKAKPIVKKKVTKKELAKQAREHKQVEEKKLAGVMDEISAWSGREGGVREEIIKLPGVTNQIVDNLLQRKFLKVNAAGDIVTTLRGEDFAYARSS